MATPPKVIKAANVDLAHCCDPDCECRGGRLEFYDADGNLLAYCELNAEEASALGDGSLDLAAMILNTRQQRRRAHGDRCSHRSEMVH
jgi:hypothetical protein